MANYGIGSVATRNTAGNIPASARLKYGASDAIVMKEYANAPMMAILTERTAKEGVASTEFRGFEVGHKIHEGLISHASSFSTSATTFTVTDKTGNTGAASFLIAGDILYIPSSQTNQNNGSADIAGEQLVVISVSGTSTIEVVRRNGAGTNAANVTAATTNTLNWYHAGNRNVEGYTAGEARAQSVDYEMNYIQNLSETFDITEEAEVEDMWGPSNEYEFRAQLALKDFMLKAERQALVGQRYRTHVSGKPVRQGGGALWFITNLVNLDSAAPITSYTSWSATADLVEGTAAARSRVWKITSVTNPDKWSTKKFDILGEQIFSSTGSPEKYLFVGSGFYTEFQQLFDKYTRAEWETTVAGLKYKQYRVGGGVFNVIPDPIMDITGWSLGCIGLDLKFVKRVYLNGYDVQRRDRIQNKGDHNVKGEWFGRLSMKFNNWDSHFFAYISSRT